MERKDLKKKLTEIKIQIKENSVDAHLAGKLIADLLSVKRQIDHEPTLVHIPMGDIEDKLEGDTFGIYALKSGDAVYHLKGGYTLVASNNYLGLNDALRGYVANQHLVESELTEEDKQLYDNDLWASCYLLNLPTIAFSDLEFKYKMVNHIIDHLKEWQDKYLAEMELQDETPDADKAFKDATIALEDIKSDIANGNKG